MHSKTHRGASLKKIDNLNNRIYVAGHRGMVGSAIVRQLKVRRYRNIITRSRAELDLTDQSLRGPPLKEERPHEGGIHPSNTYPAEFSDGFCGGPTCLHFSALGHEVAIVGNLSRRGIEIELECDSLTRWPVPRSPWGSVASRSADGGNLDDPRHLAAIR